jgi:hypothetical protein
MTGPNWASGDALPLPGPEKGECGCGCGLFGGLKKTPMKDGLRHVKGCQCARCRGRNYKRSATGRENRIAKRVGGERAPLSGALSGYDIRVPLEGGGWAFIEETTQANFCRGLDKWWGTAVVQLKLSRLLHRKDGLRVVMTPGLMVMPRVDGEALLKIARERNA